MIESLMLKPVLSSVANWISSISDSDSPEVKQGLANAWRVLGGDDATSTKEQATSISEAVNELASLLHSNSLPLGNLAETATEASRAKLEVGHEHLQQPAYSFDNMPGLLIQGMELRAETFDRTLAKVTQAKEPGEFILTFYADPSNESNPIFGRSLLDDHMGGIRGHNDAFISLRLKNTNEDGEFDPTKLALRFERSRKKNQWTSVDKFIVSGHDLVDKFVTVAKDAQLQSLFKPVTA